MTKHVITDEQIRDLLRAVSDFDGPRIYEIFETVKKTTVPSMEHINAALDEGDGVYRP